MMLCSPVLPMKNYVVWDGCGFLDPLYLKYEKAQHPGIDLNGRGGGDTDLGANVYAIADGVVTHAQGHRVWGNIVLIHHPELGVWSQYAHLDVMQVKVGQTIRVGERLGTIGKGGTSPQFPKGRFLAHLHFEIRTVDVPADEWPSANREPEAAAAYIRRTRVDPAEWLERHDAVWTLEELEAALNPVPAAPRVKDIPALPPRRRAGAGPDGNWYPVHTPQMQPIPGAWDSVVQSERTGEFRLVRVPDEKLRAAGLL